MTIIGMTESLKLLKARAFVTQFPKPIGQLVSSELVGMLSLSAPVPLKADDRVRSEVRALLRAGGFKPSGRSKPASEYLLRAAIEGNLGSINSAVDACNVISLHSGLPISVIDLDLAQSPFRIAVAGQNSEYVFNPSGQSIALDGLVCLFDTQGPCGSPVKDSQRTKTHAATTRTLTVIWAPRSLDSWADRTEAWYRELLISMEATLKNPPDELR